jgi:hypothetical protein
MKLDQSTEKEFYLVTGKLLALLSSHDVQRFLCEREVSLEKTYQLYGMIKDVACTAFYPAESSSPKDLIITEKDVLRKVRLRNGFVTFIAGYNAGASECRKVLVDGAYYYKNGNFLEPGKESNLDVMELLE